MRSLVALAFLVTACSADFAVPDNGKVAGPPVSVEPIGSVDAAPAVFRLRVTGGARRSVLSDYRVFSGELGAYHLGRIRNRELPATLLEREIPVLAWVEARDVLVAPLAALESGTYALATPELGLVTDVAVDAALVPVLERVWPARETTSGAGLALFCGEADSAVVPGEVELAPTGVKARVSGGLDDDGAFSDVCMRVEPDEAVASGVPLLPPALAGNVALEPRLLVALHDESAPAPCAQPALALGPTCATIADDRIELHASGSPAFVAFEKPQRLLGVVDPSASLVFRGFEPASLTRVTGVMFDALGERVPIDLEIRTEPVRPHLVLNEVLANPAGPEALGEWIELVNDGSQPVELDGFVLDDAIEPVALPALAVAPGEMVLVVADGYAPDPELDAAPPPDVVIVTLPRLGRKGLTNAGELLRLRDRDGNVVSRFPALPAPGAGQSVARRAPDAPDEDASSFGPHAAPGASPGRPNVVVAE